MRPEKFGSRFEIYLEMLAIVRDEGRVKPTHVLQRANLSHDRFAKYLGDLVSKGLIVEDRSDGNRSYFLSSSGRLFLEEVNKTEEFLLGFDLSL